MASKQSSTRRVTLYGRVSTDCQSSKTKLLKGVARKDFDVVGACSVDRLGRSLIDLLQGLHATGLDLYFTSRA